MRSEMKQTVIGEIPADWEVIQVGDVFTIETGKKNAQDAVDDGEYPFFTRAVSIPRIDTYSYDTEALFIAGEGNFKIKYYKGRFDVHQRTYVLTSSGKRELNLQFYKEVIDNNLEKLVSTSVGSTVQSLRKPIIAELVVPLPPLPEQQKIAEILSTVDEKLAVMDEQLAQTQELKKGLMQRLLTRGIGHTAFKESPLGVIPESWEVKQINEVTSYVDYRGKTPPKVDSGVFLVTARNVKNGRIDYSLSQEYVPNELYDEVMGRGKPKIGDVLITTEAPLGEVASIDREDIALAQRIIKYRADASQLDSGYFKYFLLSPMFQLALEKESTGSTVKGIKGSRLHKMQLLIPTSLSEQRQIAEILTTLDDKIQVLTDKKVRYQELKSGLMQQLLTGKRRFININHAI